MGCQRPKQPQQSYIWCTWWSCEWSFYKISATRRNIWWYLWQLKGSSM